MVESQRRVVDAPVYGQMPKGTEEGRAAARRRRDQANRRRKRKRILGWIATCVVLVGLGVAGFLAYRAYQDDQRDDQRDEEPVATSPDPSDDDPAGPAPDTEPVEADAASADGDPAGPGAGGPLDAVDDARTAVDDLAEGSGPGSGPASDTGSDTASGTASGPASDTGSDGGSLEAGTRATAPATGVGAAPAGTERVAYYHRTHDSADGDPADGDPASAEYAVVYDLVTDTFEAEVWPADGSGTITVATDAQHRYTLAPGGRLERMRRSTTGLDPAPDLVLARPIVAADLVPPEASPFAGPAEIEVEPDGTSYVRLIDLDAWRRADPRSYDVWVASWSERGPLSQELVEATSRQVARHRVAAHPSPVPPHRDALTELEQAIGTGSGVAYRVAADGLVVIATVVDRVADFRSSYVAVAEDAVATDVGLSALDLGGQVWVDAP